MGTVARRARARPATDVRSKARSRSTNTAGGTSATSTRDHEAVYHTGAEPLVSHYNNQYDAVAGFAMPVPAHRRRALVAAAWTSSRAHVIDIDIYHTTRDKAAYNGGLFWHTYHYVDAGTATHRTYPRASRRVGGGGPSNEHNYTTGLMLHYFLTGDPRIARGGDRAGATG